MKKVIIKLYLWYLQTAAKIQLKKIKPKIISFTGSAGKTSLLNALGAVMQADFKIKKSVKANSETGLPLDLLGLHPKDYSLREWFKLGLRVLGKLLTNWQKYDYYLAELGVDDPYPPKNMDYLLRFIKPDVSIFLNVGSVHCQQFEKIIPKGKVFESQQQRQQFLLAAIAQEKGKIITRLPKDKIGLVNLDDPLVLREAVKSKAQLYFFGKDRSISKLQMINKQINNKLQINKWLKITNYQVDSQGTSFTFQWQGEKICLKLKYLLPEYYDSTFSAALLTGLVVGLPLERGVRGLAKNFVLPPGRMSVFPGIKQTILIDSSYNASKEAVSGALELLVEIGKKRKKVVVLGDMRELGKQAAVEHQAVAEKILTTVDQAILVGPQVKKYIYPVLSSKKPVRWFKNSWLAGEWLKKNLSGGEIILIKGSQNTIFTEIVVEQLLADKTNVSKLCRRGTFWDKQRLKLR